MFNDASTRDFFNDIISMALKRPNLRESLENDPVEVFRLLGFKLKNDLKFVFYDEMPLVKEPDVVYIKISGGDEVDLNLDDLAYVNGGGSAVKKDFGQGTQSIELVGGINSIDQNKCLGILENVYS